MVTYRNALNRAIATALNYLRTDTVLHNTPRPMTSADHRLPLRWNAPVSAFRLPVLALMLTLTGTAFGNTDLQVRNIQLISLAETTGETRLLFDLSWSNAWRSDRNHDAAWIFVKVIGEAGQFHVRIAPDGHRVQDITGDPTVEGRIDVSEDNAGLFVYPAGEYRGGVSWRLSIRLDSEQIEEAVRAAGDNVRVSVFGIEMVYIPPGPFYAGDPDEAATQFTSFYASDGNGGAADFFHIDSEDPIPVGPNAGELHYIEAEYGGDRGGPIPAAFPKGTRPFYIMKYELSQGQYVNFLSSIGDDAAYRAHFDDDTYEAKRGTIRYESGHYVAGVPHRPLNFMQWDDGLAFADWAGLRPMTEFEFAKAARGPDRPAPRSFPWGDDSRERLARIVGTEDDLIMTNGWDESRLTDATRPLFGASFYWVMDLAGSVWERVVTPSRSDGRVFTGSHGDGVLGEMGRATNDDWPHGYLEREGHGYRGGGFYDQGRPAHEFNPWSPVAYRRFGGWSGHDPHRAYGFRAVRTADTEGG